jgi:hypothetical protein
MVGALELSTDHRALFFGLMQPGEEKTLEQAGSFHNEVTCSSTSAMPWYLKISVLQPLTSGVDEIPLERFTWQLVRTDGGGTTSHQGRFQSFELIPDLVYISGPGESSGQPIRFLFRYGLMLPEATASGSYSTTIRFTLTEVL